MGKSTANFFVDGTAALDPRRHPKSPDNRFVAFKGTTKRPQEYPKQRIAGADASRHSVLRDVLERSEMACSLATEDVKGVSYDVFTKANVATISIACSVIGVLSILFGA